MLIQLDVPTGLLLMNYTREGWPSNKSSLPGALMPYWQYANELSIKQDLLLKGERLVILTTLRLEMLDRIHSGHQGITKCLE